MFVSVAPSMILQRQSTPACSATVGHSGGCVHTGQDDLWFEAITAAWHHYPSEGDKSLLLYRQFTGSFRSLLTPTWLQENSAIYHVLLISPPLHIAV